MRFLPDRFVLLMVCAVVLALIFPAWGAADGPLHLGAVTAFGIALVFFLHGANLAPEKLAMGVRNWRAHLLIQATTFIVFPVLGLILFFSLQNVLPDALRLGFFFLAALSSTVSSSVALTGIAKGNIPVAVFNATLSGLIGMILTPAMVSLVSKAGAGDFSLLDAMIDIGRTLLAPFIAGQLLRPLVKTVLDKYKWLLTRLDRGVILLIVFTSFASSTKGGIWSEFSLMQFGATGGLVLVLLSLALTITMQGARLAGLSREDEAAIVFCGSTKSLANGAPIAQILFAGSASLGPIMLPLMLYHQFQLMACAVIAQRYSRSAHASDTV